VASHLLAIDEGTTRATVVVVDEMGAIVANASCELRQHYPRPGWVEQDPIEIWESVLELSRSAISSAGLMPQDIAAIGITNQRETTVLWEKATGRPVYPAIVWQDRRGADLCQRLDAEGTGEAIVARTGLVLDPYFSASKISWLLERDAPMRRAASRGEICFGTVDSWLIWNLTKGGAHVTEATNASRTLLMDLQSLTFEDELLEIFGVERPMLPAIQPSGSVFGEVSQEVFGTAGIPIAGVLGDQQSALFAQGCHRPGQAKNTYGTGSFILCNTGTAPVTARGRLLATVAVGGNNKADYALEGSIFSTGATVQWLRDGLGLIHDAKETEALAASLGGNDDVWFVPALAGLGAPFWDPDARGTLLGATRATTRAHVVRAVLESIAWRTRDVLEAMAGLGRAVTELRVDGGGAANAWLMQFQADVTGIPVDAAGITETTSLGAAYLAGLTVGTFMDRDNIDALRVSGRRFEPTWSKEMRDELYARWLEAIERSRSWVKKD
jgi:glycerol kinase